MEEGFENKILALKAAFEQDKAKQIEFIKVLVHDPELLQRVAQNPQVSNFRESVLFESEHGGSHFDARSRGPRGSISDNGD